MPDNSTKSKPDALKMLRDVISVSGINDQGRGRYFVREIKPEHLEPIISAIEAERNRYALARQYVNDRATQYRELEKKVADTSYELSIFKGKVQQARIVLDDLMKHERAQETIIHSLRLAVDWQWLSESKTL